MQRGKCLEMLETCFVLQAIMIACAFSKYPVHKYSHFVMQCYDEKGREAADGMDDDIRPWLKSFVESVGPEKAKKLLAGAGHFVRLA